MAFTMTKSSLSWISKLILTRENLQERNPTGWKRLSSLGCESMAPSAKSKMSISKRKGLEGSTWIKNGAIVKEAFKYSKAFSTSTPQEKGWSF